MKQGILFSLAAPFILSGCINLLPEPGNNPERFSLNTTETKAAAIGKTLPPIKLTRPSCPENLNSCRIVVIQNDEGLRSADYLADTEWKEPLPGLVENTLIDLLTTSGSFLAVGGPEIRFAPEYILYTHIHHFEVNVGEQTQPMAHVCLTMTFMGRKDYKILSQKTLEVTHPISEKSRKGFVRALDDAFKKNQVFLLEWINGISTNT